MQAVSELEDKRPVLSEIKFIMDELALHPKFSALRFSKIETVFEYNQVKEFRLKKYAENLQYMLSEFNQDGSDQYDKHAFIFAAWHENKIVASARLIRHPFESACYVEEDKLRSYLGNDCENNYLEWSRLLVDTSLKLKGVVSGLTIYAGLYVLANTSYSCYFGYTRHSVRRILSKFQLKKDTLSFSIPHRGDHVYFLLKGSFVREFYFLKKNFLAK